MIGMIGFGLFVAVQIILVFARGGSSGASGLVLLSLIFTVVFGSLFLVIWIYVRPQRKRLKVLKARHPDRIVLPVIHPQGTDDLLKRHFAGYGGRIGGYSVMVITDDQMQFWKGSRTPELRFVLPLSRITGVKAGHTVVNRPVPAMCLDVVDDSGDSVVVPISRAGEGWKIAFSSLRPEAISSFVAQVRVAVLPE